MPTEESVYRKVIVKKKDGSRETRIYRGPTLEATFDDVAMALAEGSLSRGRVLRLLGAALFAGALVSLPGRASAQPADRGCRPGQFLCRAGRAVRGRPSCCPEDALCCPEGSLGCCFPECGEFCGESGFCESGPLCEACFEQDLGCQCIPGQGVECVP
jgi:hypothetical protein